VIQEMGYQRKAYLDQFPGNGPFSYLPPWQRPGRAYGSRGYGRGRGANLQACARFPVLPRWWWVDPAHTYQPPTQTPQDEIATLETSKKELADEKAGIEQEINDIETHLKELKSKFESEKKQPTVQ